MLDDFMVRAVLAGLGVAVAAGPLGAFVVWRRMAYFGDATAHASVLGVALALGFGISVYWGTAFIAIGMALLITAMTQRGQAVDTTLGVLAHSALALGLVAASLVPGLRTDLNSWLFGDILAVGRSDLAVIAIAAPLVAGVLLWRWQRLLTATVSEELAMASGIDPRIERLILSLCLAITVAVSIRIVGALLISALLVIPAAAARPLARTPEGMALAAAGVGMGSVIAGLTASLYLDLPAGPAIVTVSAVLFLLTALFSRKIA